MQKFNSRMHGVIDYAVVIFLWSSPALIGLPKITSIFAYALGGVHLLLTISTEFELGIIKRIPLNIHGLIALVVSLVLVGMALFLGYIEGELSEVFYLFFALAV